MPVSFVSASQRESYGRYVGDPSPQELARYFHLDDADRAQIADKRGDDNRLGFALQLTTVRFVGTFLEDPAEVPVAVMSAITRQLGIDPSTDLTDYREGKWRFAHAAQIRTDHEYREYTDRTAGFGLARWLYVQCWTGTERPSALFDRATTWMLAHKVLLPGATPLERFVAKLRQRVEDPYGFRCDWGRILEWNPPHLLAFTWQIGPKSMLQPDPDQCTEVWVTFGESDPGESRIKLTHKYFERHGDDAARYRADMASDYGWPLLLQTFASAARA